jgi:hypothetical protein
MSGADSAESKELIATGFVTIMSFFLVSYAYHCVWATSEAYSSPSIVLSARGHDGSRIIFDDFREAYWWLRMNTPEDAKVMSWWDYGYQITAMANRCANCKVVINQLIVGFLHEGTLVVARKFITHKIWISHFKRQIDLKIRNILMYPFI